MRKRLLLFLAAAAMMLGLIGCGSEDAAVSETMIEFKKDGSVIHTIVESFAEEYYDLQELEDMIQSACDSYNASADEDAVTITATELDQELLTVTMSYKNTAAYAGFNQYALFCGTIKDAYNAGYDLDITLYSLQDDSDVIGKEEILGMSEKHIVILREAVDVKVWDKVIYVSADVVKTGNNKIVMVSDSSRLSYIIFE